MQDHVQMYRSLLQSVADYSQECLGILEHGAGDLPQWTNDIISRTRAWMKDVTHFLRGQDNRGVRYGGDYHGRAYMATKNLREIHEYALESLSYLTGDGILPPWVEKKISVCEEYMDLVGHWLENEYVEGRRYGSYLNPVPGDAGDTALYRGRADGILGEYKNPYSPNNFQHKVYEQGFHEGYGTKERRYGARGGGGGGSKGGAGGAGSGAGGKAGGGAGARGGRGGDRGGRAGGADRPGSGRGRGPKRGRGHRRGGHHRPHAHGRHIYPHYPQPYYYIQPVYEPIPIVLEAPAQEVAVAPILTEVKAKLRDPKPGEGISQRGVIELRGMNLNVIEGIGIVYAYDNEGLLGGDTGPHTSQVKITNIGPNALVFELPVGPASHMMITDIAYFAYGQSRSLAHAFFDIVPYPFQPFQGGRRRYGAETTSRPSESPGASRPRPSAERPGGERPKTPSVGLTRQPQTSTLILQEPQVPALTPHPGIQRIDPPTPEAPMLPSEMTQFMPPNRMLENHRGILHHRQLGQDTGRRFGVPGFVAGEPGWAGQAGVAQSPHPTRRIRRAAPEDPTFGPGLSAGQGGLQPWPGGGAMGKETYGSLGYGSMGIGSMDRAVQSAGARFSGTRKKPKKGRMFNTRKRKKR